MTRIQMLHRGPLREHSLNLSLDSSLLDLGCFDGSLTRKIILRLEQDNKHLENITAVEPAAAPLREFELLVKAEHRSGNWQFVNSTMETYLTQRKETFDWVVASHNLYWIGDNVEILEQIVNSARNGAIVIRDSGVMHQVEEKFRPLMTTKNKRFISSREIKKILDQKGTNYQIQSFSASMKVATYDTLEFKQLAGFLLDLTLDEIDERLLRDLYLDLHVVNGRSAYGIDIIWFGEVLLP